MRFFAGKTVRKNVNLDENVADTLERLSKVSGLSQGEILETALSQPVMMNLMAFGAKDIESPVAYIMDIYQGNGEQNMTQEVTEGFVHVLLYSILPRASVRLRPSEGSGMDVKSLNEYLATHMGNHGVDKRPGFAECKMMAEEGTFLSDDSEEESRRHIERYLRTMLAYMDDRDVHANDFLIRNLVVIFRDYCPDVAGFSTDLERRMFQYRACAKVLPLLVPFGRGGLV